MIKNFKIKQRVPRARKEKSQIPLDYLDCKHARPHFHTDENGFLVRCYHVCQQQFVSVWQVLKSPAFWIGITVTYPIEHGLYENIWPFTFINELMHGGH